MTSRVAHWHSRPDSGPTTGRISALKAYCLLVKPGRALRLHNDLLQETLSGPYRSFPSHTAPGKMLELVARHAALLQSPRRSLQLQLLPRH